MNISQNKCKHKDNTTLCYQRGNQSPRRKTSLPPSKRPIIHKRMKLGYMNSIDPPSLIFLVYLSTLSFLLQQGCAEPLSSLAYQILL